MNGSQTLITSSNFASSLVLHFVQELSDTTSRQVGHKQTLHLLPDAPGKAQSNKRKVSR
jgi:hypothetical protein